MTARRALGCSGIGVKSKRQWCKTEWTALCCAPCPPRPRPPTGAATLFHRGITMSTAPSTCLFWPLPAPTAGPTHHFFARTRRGMCTRHLDRATPEIPEQADDFKNPDGPSASVCGWWPAVPFRRSAAVILWGLGGQRCPPAVTCPACQWTRCSTW